MKLPGDSQRLISWSRELIDQCMVSREARRLQSRQWRQLYYTGSLTGAASKYNKCFSHVDKLSSYIFSPADVRFTIEFEGDALPEWTEKETTAARYMNRKFNRTGCGETFGSANEIGLVEGAGIVKLTWGPGGRLAPWTIRPSFFGVFREDIEDLDRQEAFVHSFYITPDSFRRMISRHPDRSDLMLQVAVMGSPQSAADLTGDSYFHEMITSSLGQISYTTATSTPGFGTVSLAAPGMPMLAQDVAADLIRIDDLWVWDDDRDDWTTIRMADPGILIEGKYQRRNLSDIKGQHPFVKVCSNRVPGYFWGRSELSVLFEPQNQINRTMDNISTIFNLRAKPPRAFSGFQSITEEKARALLAPGGQITEAAIGAKVDNLAPDLPPESLTFLDKLDDIFDDVAGFSNILSGQGEPGVRAGVHAGVLLRTSTPRLRDRALMAERQCSEFGNKVLGMLQTKDATVLKCSDGSSFMMSQLPADAACSVDSHTSSPAFVEDNRQLAYSLAKAGSIDGETLIEMLHPPHEDMLVSRLRARQAAQAAFAAQHPEIAAQSAKK